MDLPSVPTPPVNHSVMASEANRTSNLLNLLKFSGASNGVGSQQQTPRLGQSDHEQSQKRLQPGFTEAQQSSPPTEIHQPAPAGADPSGLLAALIRGTAHDGEQSRQIHPQQHAQPVDANPFSNGSPSADTKSFLLNLLNRPKPSQNDQLVPTETSQLKAAASQSPENATDSNQFIQQYQQIHAQSSNVYQQQTQHHGQQQAAASDSHGEVLNGVQQDGQTHSHPQRQHRETPADMSALYQQLMGSLSQSSPRSHTSLTPGHAPTAPFQVLRKDQASPIGSRRPNQPPIGSEANSLASPSQHGRHVGHRTSSIHSHHSARPLVKQTPPSEHGSFAMVDKTRESVAEAVHDLAEQADKDARQALARAEGTSGAVNAVDGTSKTQASPGQTWSPEEKALSPTQVIAEQIVQNIREGKELGAGFEATEMAAMNDTSDSGANAAGDVSQEVADSWESADQEEIVVIEVKEAPPVRVFNFPMKPFISISLQGEVAETRPEFRDESIMDIARLKKDFDQIDRNLYTASQAYMTYGMSKQGGLRVIRQDDGKDAKVFTDTKDRIFNVTMSVTPSDYDGAQREAIIGTGISGTVYWVQIRDGEKDRIEDPHLEQYGFALPPIALQDGDAPGGVLKTRARASTNHPEFFAVGRGKSINFIWPSYILQNKLFKAGHDRVVDTDALIKNCHLRINTGKAGKDFSFSEDDSVVVSLDKSGRVKFWDVRALTAIKEGSDPRSPLPSQSSLEIKEPLMTLSTNPEGEKAWPTSVLLLDKQRPYQKRCALRYMIVGMKQNHTLQLWDLSLGKPVQEFNLPHGKESDAVCSVMYHPASGMITIGHPTRNSVYFAHLSAPKYNLKSIPQAEYMQRLAARDSTLPQPDSTAVISGVREYSFANRGMLRSLDILCDPAMVQDADEPTLFELYAMHSRGVACVLVKQSELGWSKDNKVLDAVDAAKEGLVTISKLKPVLQAEPANPEPAKTLPVRTLMVKEPAPTAISNTNDAAQQASDQSVPSSVESKKAETLLLPSKEVIQAEKPERKNRKKKGTAPRDAEAVLSGTSSSPRVAQTGKAEMTGKTGNGTVSGIGGGVASESFDSAMRTMQTRLTGAVSETLKVSLEKLHTKLDEGARLRDENFNQHQIKLLDMVSEVLNENTQKVLESLIHNHFTELVIPAIGDKATKAVADVLQTKLQPTIASSVQKEIQQTLPQALNRCLRSADFVTAISERVGTSVAAAVQQDASATLSQRLTPIFHKFATQAAQQAANEVHQRHQGEIDRMRAQHMADSHKTDQLLDRITQLTEIVSAMASSQSTLEAELVKLGHQQQQSVRQVSGASAAPGHARDAGFGLSGFGPQGHHNHNHGTLAGANARSSLASFQSSQPGSNQHHQLQYQQQQYLASPEYTRGSQHLGSPRNSAPLTDVASTSKISGVAGAYADQVSKTDAEAEQDIQRRIQVIEQAINEGRLQDAMMQWIQSGKEKEIFHRCLSLQHPSRFENLPPLVLLVVIATIAKDLRLSPRLKQEIDWIEMAVRTFASGIVRSDWEQPGVREMIASISQTMQLLISRLTPLMAGFDSGYPVDPWLGNTDRTKMEWIVQSSEKILHSFAGSS